MGACRRYVTEEHIDPLLKLGDLGTEVVGCFLKFVIIDVVVFDLKVRFEVGEARYDAGSKSWDIQLTVEKLYLPVAKLAVGGALIF